jgi:hypothetical protein
MEDASSDPALPAGESPAGSAEFVLSEPEEADVPADPPGREEELSNLRIRQIAALRRGAYRSRSYCIVGLVALAVAAVKLILMTVRHVHDPGQQLWSVGYLLAAAAALVGAAFFAGRALELTREVAKPLLVDPPVPPDFSTLSDGSQQARHLEEM